MADSLGVLNWRRALVAIVTLCLLGALIARSALDLRRAMSDTAALYSKRIVGLSTQGDLQYATQESRRTFLYVFTTVDRDDVLKEIDRTRQADLQVSLLTARSLLLSMGTRENAILRELEQQWNTYLETRDDVLALVLQGRRQEALALERVTCARAFDRASASIRTLKTAIDRAAFAEQQSIASSFRRAIVQLIALTLAALAFVAGLIVMNRRRRRLVLDLTSANARLASSEQLERRRRDILEQVARNTHLDDTLQAIIALLGRHWPGAASAIALIHSRKLHVPAHRGLSAGLKDKLESLLPSTTKDNTVELHVASRTGRDLLDASRSLLASAFASSQVSPMLSSGGEVLGAVMVGFPNPNSANPGASAVLTTATQLAVIATEHRRLYDQLAYQAQHDPLTGLPNRVVFQDKAQRVLSHAANSRSSAAVLWADLDGFKRVNDRLGHHVGDRLLQAAAHRVQSCVRAGDVVARIGGDEFILALAGITGAPDALATAERIRAAFQEPIAVFDHQITITCSIGLSVFPDHGADLPALSRNADAALYLAKRSGRNTCVVFEPAQDVLSREQAQIERHLAQALENGEFRLQYQPQLDATGRVAAAEALLRWCNPSLGSVSPAKFIPVAEHTGLIVPIGAWVMKEACRQAAHWNRLGASCRVAVNVSAVQFNRSDFQDTVRHALSSSGLNPKLLELEVTESCLMTDLTHAAQQIAWLRSIGVEAAIDDFGTGYCSLSYLQHLPVRTLKLDQSLLQGIATPSAESTAILEAVVTMARGLSLRTVAEGVENEDQLDLLRRIGCDLYQGFLFQAPMDPGAFVDLLNGAAQTDLHRLSDAVCAGQPAAVTASLPA